MTLNGFRRFAEPAELRTNGKLVAILGPNEAGKTSLLAAITHIGHKTPFSKSDLTRGRAVGDDDVILTSRFRLDEGDLAAARLTTPTWYVLQKRASGKQTYVFEPDVAKRDISNRKKIASSIDRIRKNNKLWGRLVGDVENVIETFDSALGALASQSETLTDGDFEILESLAEISKTESVDADPLYFRDLHSQISEQISLEKEATPKRFAADIIFSRIPKILLFSNDDRLLKGSYELDELSESIPPALENLCKVAQIEIRDLVRAIREEDGPEIARLKSKANDELKIRAESWSQSGVHVALDVMSDEIHVFVREENYHFTRLAERSDGLRQFVALQAFTTCERAENPILLIDEAEMRLHYDAQADLVQILSKQTVSPKIIYTTHSAG